VGKFYSKFNESELIMKLSNQLLQQTYQSNCKNLVVVNDYICYYQQYTRNTVENILKLSSMIVEMKDKEKSGELDKSDMIYFCHSVGLKRDGSTFRKFEQIGKHSALFWKYVNKLPDSYTVLYEITTLDADKFEELMSNNQITSYVTLKDIKSLGNKISNAKSPQFTSSITVKFDTKLLNKESRKLLTLALRVLNQLDKNGLMELVIPKFNRKNKSNAYNFLGETSVGNDGKITSNPDHRLNKSLTDDELLELEEFCS
jgi:hypothetical protein